MIAEEFIALLRASPFVPFTVHLHDGSEVTVSHPDYCLVSPTRLTAHVYTDDAGHLAIISFAGVSKLTTSEVTP
jgi:hypothetical protein